MKTYNELNEVTTNKAKKAELSDMMKHLKGLLKSVDNLNKLDDDAAHSGYGDVFDQLTTMFELGKDFKSVIDKTNKIIPKRG
jgi:hypothetical protein